LNIFVWKWSKIATQKKFFFADFALVHPLMASVLLSASVERCFVSRMGDFLIHIQIAHVFSFPKHTLISIKVFLVVEQKWFA
jgi:hypothetical protein